MILSKTRNATFRYVAALFICLLFAATEVSAQQGVVSLSRRTVTLSELFSEIERQTGSTLMFNVDKTMLNKQVTLPSTQGSVSEMLDAVLPGAGYTWQMIDKDILVRRAEKPVQEQVVTHNVSPAEFERGVKDYTAQHLGHSATPGMRYDTVTVEVPHDGRFSYPSREFTPNMTDVAARTVFARTTPPLFAVKTNLLWWAAKGTINLGGEIGLGKKTSLEISGGLNRWNLKTTSADNKKLTHWVVKPEFRYWLCERFNGHFFGVHALYGQYNVSAHDIPLLFEKEYRYEGDAYGAGVNYGYHLPLTKHWGLEFVAGAGVIRMEYTKYDCPRCGSEIDTFGKTYFGPTELGVKLIFVIK